MAKTKTWYEQGYDDGSRGDCDPPYQPGNNSYELYMSGCHDGNAYLEREREQGDYYGMKGER